MGEAAAGLVYLFGDEDPVVLPALRLVAETATTVTLQWDPVEGCVGYRFSSALLGDKKPHTWDVMFQRDKNYAPCNTRLARAAWYAVEPLFAGQALQYPLPVEPTRALISSASLQTGG